MKRIFSKNLWIDLLGILLFAVAIILMFKVSELENKFWLGFVSGTYATIIIGAIIIAIRQSENK